MRPGERKKGEVRCLAGDSRLGSAWSHCWLSTRLGPGLTGKFSDLEISIFSSTGNCWDFSVRETMTLHCTGSKR